MRENRLSLDGLIDRTVHDPRRIFGLPEQPDTWIEVDPDEDLDCARHGDVQPGRWTPFEGRALRGRVQRVVLRGVRRVL